MKSTMLAVLLALAILLGAIAGYLAESGVHETTTLVSTTTTTITTTSVDVTGTSKAQGVVTGMVTVGGQTPSNISKYSLVFKPSPCSGGSCEASIAPIYPSGHYTALLEPGNYTLGLLPSCRWSGCQAAFHRPVAVLSGQQIVVNIDIGNE